MDDQPLPPIPEHGAQTVTVNSYPIYALEMAVAVKITGMEEQSEQVDFHLSNGKIVRMHHQHDCCESVYLADFEGDLDDLLFAPFIEAEYRTHNGPPGSSESHTWTFVHLTTWKGTFWMRWLGESNGYYGEEPAITVLGDDND